MGGRRNQCSQDECNAHRLCCGCLALFDQTDGAFDWESSREKVALQFGTTGCGQQVALLRRFYSFGGHGQADNLPKTEHCGEEVGGMRVVAEVMNQAAVDL